jgi:hypothetical protein
MSLRSHFICHFDVASSFKKCEFGKFRHERANTTDGEINQNNNTSEQIKTIITTTWNGTNTNIKDKKRKGDIFDLNALKQPKQPKAMEAQEATEATEAVEAKEANATGQPVAAKEAMEATEADTTKKWKQTKLADFFGWATPASFQTLAWRQWILYQS